MRDQTGMKERGSGVIDLSFLWLEITGKCQLSCRHCYAESGPHGSHGMMEGADWCRVIDQASDLGVRMVQFIGGEPTLHRDLPKFVERALSRHLEVEVFSNLVHVSPRLREVFAQPGVSLAASYYSDSATEHQQITGRRGSHARTRANIAEAVRRSIPLRVGVIDVQDGQRVAQAQAEMAAMGAGDVRVDRLRQVGRGVRDGHAGLSELCGQCGQGKVAVGPDGSVWPCVFSRWLPVGNVRAVSLAAVLDSPEMARTASALATRYRPLIPQAPCVPGMCDPQCGPACSPACVPAQNCRPVGACVPTEY